MAVVFIGSERRTAKIAFHVLDLLGGINDSGLLAEARVFLEAQAEMSDALGLKQIVKSTHLRAVVSPGENFGGATRAQLAVSCVTVSTGLQFGPHACRILLYRWLAAIAPRRARFKRDKRKSH